MYGKTNRGFFEGMINKYLISDLCHLYVIELEGV